MKLVSLLHLFATLLLGTPLLAQNVVTFEDQGWNSDQSLDSIFTTGNFLFSGNKNFYTNYGYNFDVYNVSIFFVFQNPVEDQFTITTLDNELFDLKSMAAYQVSELSTDTLIIEGWNGSSKEYTGTFSNITTWQILTLNYDNINKAVIKLEPSGNGGLTDFNFDNFIFGDRSTVLEDSTSLIPKSYNLSQNYPNPFNPGTVINYQLPQAGKVTLKIYDILGNEVSTLVDGNKDAGSYSVTFSANGGSASGGNAGSLPSGIYIYELTAVDPSTGLPAGRQGSGHSFVSRNKMMLIK